MDKLTTQPSGPTSKNTSSVQIRFRPVNELGELLAQVPEQGKRDDLDDRILQTRELHVRHWLKLGAIGLLAIIGAVLVCCYVLNLVFPPCWRWLSPDDMAVIKDMVTSIIAGLLMSLAIQFFTKTKQK